VSCSARGCHCWDRLCYVVSCTVHSTVGRGYLYQKVSTALLTPLRAQKTAYIAPKRALQPPISSSTDQPRLSNTSTGQQTPASTHEQHIQHDSVLASPHGAEPRALRVGVEKGATVRTRTGKSAKQTSQSFEPHSREVPRCSNCLPSGAWTGSPPLSLLSKPQESDCVWEARECDARPARKLCASARESR